MYRQIAGAFLVLIWLGIFAARTTGQENEAGSEHPGNGEVEKVKYERTNWKLKRGAKEVAMEFGFAPMQPTFLSGRKEYDTDGRRFAIGSIRFGRVIGTAKGVTYEYLFEVMPVSFAIKNEVKSKKVIEDPTAAEKSYTVRENTYGIGIHPSGFRFVFIPKRRLKPYVQASTGFLFTSKPCRYRKAPRIISRAISAAV